MFYSGVLVYQISTYFQLPEFQPEEADPLKMLDAWRNRAEWYEYSSGR